MKSKVVKTELGWEPAFCWPDTKEWVVEPGFAKPTRQQAQEALNRDNEQAARINASERAYSSQYAYACGYYD